MIFQIRKFGGECHQMYAKLDCHIVKTQFGLVVLFAIFFHSRNIQSVNHLVALCKALKWTNPWPSSSRAPDKSFDGQVRDTFKEYPFLI